MSKIYEGYVKGYEPFNSHAHAHSLTRYHSFLSEPISNGSFHNLLHPHQQGPNCEGKHTY